MNDYGIQESLHALGIKEVNEGVSTGSKWLPGSGEPVGSFSPVDGKLIGKVYFASEDQYNEVVETAARAFKSSCCRFYHFVILVFRSKVNFTDQLPVHRRKRPNRLTTARQPFRACGYAFVHFLNTQGMKRFLDSVVVHIGLDLAAQN